MIDLKAQKIAVLDHTTPGRRRVNRMKDGKLVAIERIPWQTYMKAVHPSGAVVRVPLSTHRANNERQDPYRLYMEHHKVRIGFVPYGICPQTLPFEIQERWVPESLRGRAPCRTSISGGKIDAETCCACMEELITLRKEAQLESMGKIEQKTSAQLQAEASVGLVAAMKEMAGVVKDMKTAGVTQPLPPADSSDRKGRDK